jgi:hypothetical protein
MVAREILMSIEILEGITGSVKEEVHLRSERRLYEEAESTIR